MGRHHRRRAQWRLIIAGICGVVAGIFAAQVWNNVGAVLVGWDVALLVYLLRVYGKVWQFDGQATQTHAVTEDPSRRVAEVVIISASLASLVAIVLLLMDASHSHGGAQSLLVGFAVLSVVLSWLSVHTLYMLRYAELYYSGQPGGVDFGDTKMPCYKDFAYLSFTLGMTFQVSDTNLTKGKIRHSALGHAILSYVFGTIIVASTINLVITLTS